MVAALLSPSIITLAGVLVVIFGAGSSYLNYKLNKLASDLREQFIEFLAVFRAAYLNCNSVFQAMESAIQTAPSLIKEHAKIMNEILNTKNYKGALNRYNDRIPDSAMRIFLSDVLMVGKYGDTMVGNRTNLMISIDKIQESLYARRTQTRLESHAFAGVDFVLLMPILTLGKLKEWALENVPMMSGFFNGVSGFVAVVIFFVVTITTFLISSKLRVMYKPELSDHTVLKMIYRFPFVSRLINNYEYKNYGRTMKKKRLLKQVGEFLTPELLLIKQVLSGIAGFVGVVILCAYLVGYNKTISLTYVTDTNVATADAKEESYSIMKQAVVDTTFEFREHKKDTLKNEVKLWVEQQYDRDLRPIEQEVVVSEVIRRVHSYQSSYFRWWYLIIAQLVAFLAFLFPSYLVTIRSAPAKIAMDDEVLQFKMVTLMLCNIEQMTIDMLVGWYHAFSTIFRSSIRRCLNSLPKGEQKALKELKKSEPLDSFRHLVDDLIACDKVTMTQAFSNLDMECADYLARRNQYTVEFIDNRSAVMDLVCLFPAGVILVGYLMLPFMQYGFNAMSKVMVGLF